MLCHTAASGYQKYPLYKPRTRKVIVLLMTEARIKECIEILQEIGTAGNEDNRRLKARSVGLITDEELSHLANIGFYDIENALLIQNK